MEIRVTALPKTANLAFENNGPSTNEFQHSGFGFFARGLHSVHDDLLVQAESGGSLSAR